jgi:hypothetical protein
MHPSSCDSWAVPPAKLSGYQFVRLIEVTAYTRRSVYQEADQGGHVLLEELHPGVCVLEGFDQHYQEHMEKTAMIAHPACLRIISHGCGPTGSYLILREWVEGSSLHEWTGGRPCDPAVVFAMCVEIGWALSAMHDKGVLHGSLDSSRVWLDAHQKPKLEVFPVSTLVKSFLQQGGEGPAQADPALDVRALAALAYGMLTGHAAPATHDGMFFPPYLSAHAKRVISNAYTTPPALPYATMAGFCSDLLQIACAPSQFDAPGKGRLKKPTSHLLAITACIVVLAGLTAFLAYRQIFGSAPARHDAAVATDVPASGDPAGEEEIVLLDEIPDLQPVEEDPGVVVEMPEDLEEEVVEPGEPEGPLVPAARAWPTPPEPGIMGGDAFLYAAHFYFGDQVGLLKLQFGNAGESPLDIADLSFQCAFSVDDKLDPLLPASAGALPMDGLDVAAGGFSGSWLGMSLAPLASQRKVWMKPTFRIDTSTRELFEHAKFLIVKISPFYQIPESNYKNNTIVIPLENQNQWNTSTQDPKQLEAETAVEAGTDAGTEANVGGNTAPVQAGDGG